MNQATLLQPTAGLKAVIQRLVAAGHPAFAVGGAVRDSLRGERVGDWDVATAAHPEVVQSLFPVTFPIGVEHGTVGVRAEGETIEVTTFRTDVATDGRHAEVRFGATLEEDLERRDFTINAIAWDLENDTVIDPFDGRSDLEAGVLRAVGEPDRRFPEDYLRVLRAFRFAVRFGLEIEPETERALEPHAAGVVHLSGERVRDELLKTLAECRSVSSVLDMWRQYGVMALLFPELAVCFGVEQNVYHADDVGVHTLLVADNVHPRRPFLRVVALCHDLGKPMAREVHPDTGDWTFPQHEVPSVRLTRQALRRLKFSRREVARAVHLVRVHMDLPPPDASDAAIRRWIRRVGEEHLWDLYRLQLADWRGNRKRAERSPTPIVDLYHHARRVLKQQTALRVEDLAIDGNDLVAMGLAPGPEFGQTLEWLLEQVIEQPALNTRETLLEMVREQTGLQPVDHT
jgi:tRNA nucleotidyltransferase/poly(A) polymerase